MRPSAHWTRLRCRRHGSCKLRCGEKPSSTKFKRTGCVAIVSLTVPTSRNSVHLAAAEQRCFFAQTRVNRTSAKNASALALCVRGPQRGKTVEDCHALVKKLRSFDTFCSVHLVFVDVGSQHRRDVGFLRITVRGSLRRIIQQGFPVWPIFPVQTFQGARVREKMRRDQALVRVADRIEEGVMLTFYIVRAVVGLGNPPISTTWGPINRSQAEQISLRLNEEPEFGFV